MGWRPNYIDLDDLKEAVGIEDTNDDVLLLAAIAAASRAIDQHCGRQFGLLDTPAERFYRLRYDRRRSRYVIGIDDLMTTDGIAIAGDNGDGNFGQTLTLDTDVRLYPYNAAADGLAWTAIVAGVTTLIATTFQPFPDRVVRVTAQWGWTRVPDVVIQATIIQAARFFKRKDAPFGVAGSPEIGSEMRLLAQLDPDVAVLLDPVRRTWGVC